MYKKWIALVMAFALVFSFTVPASVDAASYKSPTRSYSPSAPGKQPSTNYTRPTPAPDKATTNPINNSTAKRGFFSGGGSLLKGMMIGGLAGMLFGGLFGHMGGLGSLLGLMVNVLAIGILISLVVGVIRYFMNRKKFDHKRY